MRKKSFELKNSKGITLIALVITIIVLLILAGISIAMLTGDNGILNKATTAKEETIKAQYEEELNLVITLIRTDAMYKNEKFDMTYIIEKLPEYLEADGKLDYVWEIEDNTIEEPEGEYKDYEFYIDKNYKAHIEGEKTGEKPRIDVKVKTTQYMIESETNVIELEVTADITEGRLEIIPPEDVEDTIEKEEDLANKKKYIYKVKKNGNYTFIAQGYTEEGNEGRKAKDTVTVNQVLEKPQIDISNNTGTSVIVNVKNNYPEEANIKYTYYINDIIISGAIDIMQNSYKIEGLTEDTEYTTKVVVEYNSQSMESNKLEFNTKLAPIIYITGDFEKTNLDYPILTENGIMNVRNNLTDEQEITIQILSIEKEGIKTYYSEDDGQTWNEYTNELKRKYKGSISIKAKSVDSEGNEYVSKILYAKGYGYDYNVKAGAENALPTEAYDGDWNNKVLTNGGKLYIDESAIGKNIKVKYDTATWRFVNIFDESSMVLCTPNFEIDSCVEHIITIPDGARYILFGNVEKSCLYEVEITEEEADIYIE